MAIEKDNPIDEEIDIQEEVEVNFDEGTEAESPEQDFYGNLADEIDDRALSQIANDLIKK